MTEEISKQEFESPEHKVRKSKDKGYGSMVRCLETLFNGENIKSKISDVDMSLEGEK